jgi:hypothetical protein
MCWRMKRMFENDFYLLKNSSNWVKKAIRNNLFISNFLHKKGVRYTAYMIKCLMVYVKYVLYEKIFPFLKKAIIV